MALIMTGLTPDKMTLTKGDESNLIVTGNEDLITNFEGWDKITMRRETSSRLTGDGDLSERGTKAARILSIGGESVFADAAGVRAFCLTLARFLSDGQRGIVEVYDSELDMTLRMAVELNVMDDPKVIGNSVEWSCELYAADPTKYGEVEDFAPEVTEIPGQPIYETLAKNEVRVYNRGASAADVYFKVTSGWASPIITDVAAGTDVRTPGLLVNTGKRFEMSANPRYLRNYTISSGSYDDYTGYLVGTPPSIPAGGSKVFRLTNLDSTADSGTNDVFLTINVVGSAETFQATYKKNSNPTYQTQIGMTPPTIANGNTIVTNNGTMKTRAIFVVSGSFPEGVMIVEANTGNTVWVYGAINATEEVPLIINSNTGKATIGNQNLSLKLTTREWTDIAPGTSATFQIATQGTDAKLVGRIETKWN